MACGNGCDLVVSLRLAFTVFKSIALILKDWS